MKRMNILDKIIVRKKEEVALAKSRISIQELEQFPQYAEATPSFCKNILVAGANGIIAEFKRKSPSKGDIHAGAKVDDILPGYEQAGVAGISVLTDVDFFGGCNDDLVRGRQLVKLPIIRKEFIIDPYQIYEAKAIGASAILLIGAILNKAMTLDLATLANTLGLEVLFEIHDEAELDQLNNHIQMVGINNRNLKTFEVDLEQSMRLAAQLPAGMIPIAESGIASVDDYLRLKSAGFKGFLMGEYFMKHPDPGAACQEFANMVRPETSN
jgi:indole-3-glycerol phosphate synthase